MKELKKKKKHGPKFYQFLPSILVKKTNVDDDLPAR